MKRRAFSLLEATLCVSLFGVLTALVFVAFRDGTRTFANLNVRQGLEGDARRCSAVLEQQLRQSDYSLIQFLNTSSRQRIGLSGGTVNRDGLCYPSLARWWEASSFDVSGRPQWDQFEVIYATLVNPGQLVRQIYRPAGVPYLVPMSNFSAGNCLSDQPKDNSGVQETHLLSSLIEDFHMSGDAQTSSVSLRLIFTQKEALRAGSNRGSQERLQIDLVIKLNNTSL